jgi:hypothetical protein
MFDSDAHIAGSDMRLQIEREKRLRTDREKRLCGSSSDHRFDKAVKSVKNQSTILLTGFDWLDL